jgi:hypothetical protein
LIPAKEGVPAHAVLIAKFPLEKIEGWAYEAVTLVPTPKGVIRVEIRSRESGTTGMREAIGIIDFMKEKNLKVAAEQFSHDPYDSRYDKGSMYVESDDAKMDASMPNHPLSRCRAAIAAYVTALQSAKLE